MARPAGYHVERVLPPLGDWARYSACKGEDPNIFFPDGYDRDQYALARSICAECPATKGCLQYALDNRVREGMWGGLSPRERKALKAQRNRATRLAREGWMKT